MSLPNKPLLATLHDRARRIALTLGVAVAMSGLPIPSWPVFGQGGMLWMEMGSHLSLMSFGRTAVSQTPISKSKPRLSFDGVGPQPAIGPVGGASIVMGAGIRLTASPPRMVAPQNMLYLRPKPTGPPIASFIDA